MDACGFSWIETTTKKDRQIDHQSFIGPLDFLFSLEQSFYETYTPYKEQELMDLFQNSNSKS